MNYWLVKSEPSVYAWSELVKDKSTVWSGVRNFAARIHLNSMKKGDHVFYYHSNEGLEIVGIATVSKEHYQDPTAADTNWVAVDLKPFKKLKKPVSLAQIKGEPRLKEMALVRISRLSVSPVSKQQYDVVIEMSNAT